MSVLACEDGNLLESAFEAPVPTLPIGESGDPVCERVQAALIGAAPRGSTERRRERRHPFPHTICLTPVDRDRKLLRGDAFFVIGKHISQGGLDFYYHKPVPYRQGIVTLPCGPRRKVALLIDLGWCRFGAHRWYENGGKFLQAVRLPEDHLELHRLDDLLIPSGCSAGPNVSQTSTSE